MFNSILTIANSFDTQPDPGSIEDTDPPFIAPLPDTANYWPRPACRPTRSARFSPPGLTPARTAE